MHGTLGRQQIIILVAMVLVTILLMSTIVASTVLHIQVWHWLASVMPNVVIGRF